MSDIHKSDIDALRKRVQTQNYTKYLLEMRLGRVRALRDQRIRFNFPVTAVIGTNGGGKSTVLGAAAMAYKNVKPGDYFPKSNIGDKSMEDWKVEYEILDRGASKTTGVLMRTAKFGSSKWRREDFLDREVLQFPIKRTVPAGEQTRYKRFIGIKQRSDFKVENLPSEVASHAGRILGKDLSDFKIGRFKTSDKDYLLLGARNKDDYSQFHFGAGEASIIEMVLQIEKSNDFSLILIEEIENGLHPIATEKMVEYLIDVADRKKCQVIFTTHSEHALRRLPPDAKWACVEGRAVPGDLSIESLRAITGRIERDKAVFVEDEFARDWVEDAIRQYARDILPAVEIHASGGYPFVVEVAKHHNQNPTLKGKSAALAVIDGDQTLAEELDFVARLPGHDPEHEIWRFISDNAESLAAIIQQRCQIPTISQDQIVKEIRVVDVDEGDRHLNFKKLGERLGFLSEIVVRRALISIYNEKNAEKIAPIVDRIKTLRPT